MKKNHLPSTRFALFIAMLLASVAAHAYDCIYGGVCYNLDAGKRTAVVTYYACDFNNQANAAFYKNAITIPGKITHNGAEYTVTAIDECAFRGCAQLTSVTFPNHLTRIGKEAFSECEALANVKFPDSLTVIGEYAFTGCHTFTEIDLSACKLETIEGSAFEYCEELASVKLPNTLTTIGDDAFQYSVKLQKIIIPDAVDSLGEDAFAHSPELREVHIGKSITTIPKGAFNACPRLSAINLPDGITSIGRHAFCECVALQQITLPAALTTISDEAFKKCSKLASITIPEAVTSIGASAFAYCTQLKEVTFNAENCEKAGNLNQFIFKGCDSIATLNIGGKVTTIPDFAFVRCSQISNPLSLPESLTYIGERAFLFCSKIPSITIPKAVTYIGPWAFCNCNSLTTVTFNAENCTYMGSESTAVFDGDLSLTTFYIGKNVASIPEYAFNGSNDVVMKIYCAAPTPPVCPEDYRSGLSKYQNKYQSTLFVLKESLELYKAANFWKDFPRIGSYNGVNGISDRLVADDATTLYDVYTTQGAQVGSRMRKADLPATLPHGIYILVAPGHTHKVRF